MPSNSPECGEKDSNPDSSFVCRPYSDAGQLIYHQIRQILSQIEEQSKLTTDQLVRPFWNGLHLWLPVLSAELFHNRMHVFPTKLEPEFGVHILAVILLGTEPSVLSKGLDTEALYLTIKTLLAQMCACDLVNLDTVKATILVSIYEYATQRSDAAFVTLTSAIRLAFVTGLDQEPTSDQLSGPEQHETNAIWWMLVICERYYNFSSLSDQYQTDTLSQALCAGNPKSLSASSTPIPV